MARHLVMAACAVLVGASGFGTAVHSPKALAVPQVAPEGPSSATVPDAVMPVLDQWVDAAVVALPLPPVAPRAEGGVADAAPPLPVPTLRDRALARFAQLGAVQWMINTFDCIGWFESKWQNIRSKTGDDGTLQINDVHDPQLAAEGLDPYVPEDAATYAWELSRQGTTFRPWSTHALCGV